MGAFISAEDNKEANDTLQRAFYGETADEERSRLYNARMVNMAAEARKEREARTKQLTAIDEVSKAFQTAMNANKVPMRTSVPPELVKH